MKEIESDIKSYLVNKKITNITFFNINDSYLDFEQKSMWVIDGGIQIDTDSETFGFGWNYEQEGFDFVLNTTIDTLLGEAPAYEVDLKRNSGINSIIGSEIIDVEFEWDFYQELDENGALKEEKIYIPVMLLLQFRSNDFLQLALIDFEIQEEPFNIVNPKFDLTGELLISHNTRIK
ncbi:hypothetical protein [uncultured Fluviicola sp.]|uniref:hypothetical protein n=1 Tax=uncultured Fluviicola sp. TaxID=463303 RepID=UPI0025DDA444|nr:hypothetical protein [uncultured Fluviicola sp.]